MSNTRSVVAARAILLLTAAIYGVIPPLVDLSETHAFHPDWPTHARFHMVWLLGVNSSLALLTAWLVLRGGVERLKMASLLGVAVFAGFFIAAATRSAYGGALVDTVGGVPPLMGMDANLLVFTPAALLQLLAVRLVHRAGAGRAG